MPFDQYRNNSILIIMTGMTFSFVGDVHTTQSNVFL
jgi:hypothetical protein